MLRRYKLKLVTTSMECAHATADVPRTPTEAINEADAMAASPLQAEVTREGEAVVDAGALLAIEVRGFCAERAHRSAVGMFSVSPAAVCAGAR